MAAIAGKNILVTGGAGFIGSHLCDGLLAEGAAKVVCVDNFFLGKMENLEDALSHDNFVLYRDDARNFGVLLAIMEKEEIEVVYNMATIALNYSFFNPFDAYMVNVEIANTLLELLKVGAYKTLVHTSSSEDLMVHSFYKVLGLDISIVRPFNNYGPRQNAQGSLAAIIPATARRMKEGGKPMVEGDGEQTRDFIYVADTVRGLILAYEKEESRGKIINLGSGKDISINTLLQGICDYMGYTGDWERRPARTSDVRNLCADSKRAKELLGFEPQTGFEEGIKKTLDWYMKRI